MSDMPALVQVVGQSFSVNMVEKDDKHLLQNNPDLPSIATMHLVEQAIYLRNDMGPDQERDSLLHELVHACLRVIGCDLSDDQQEKVAAALGPVWLDMFRRNPALVSYLVTA